MTRVSAFEQATSRSGIRILIVAVLFHASLMRRLHERKFALLSHRGINRVVALAH